jgi:hypothetical protein
MDGKLGENHSGQLRQETTLTIKSIAARMHLGTSKSANACLHAWTRSQAPAGSPESPQPGYESDEKTNHAMV